MVVAARIGALLVAISAGDVSAGSHATSCPQPIPRNATFPILLGSLSVTSLPGLITTSPNGSIDIHGHTVIIKQPDTVVGLQITFQELLGPMGPMVVDEYDESGKISFSFTVPTAADGKRTTYYRVTGKGAEVHVTSSTGEGRIVELCEFPRK
jgi:hypothetical protein